MLADTVELDDPLVVWIEELMDGMPEEWRTAEEVEPACPPSVYRHVY